MAAFNTIIMVAATVVILALSGIGIAGFGGVCLNELKSLKKN